MQVISKREHVDYVEEIRYKKTMYFVTSIERFCYIFIYGNIIIIIIILIVNILKF